MNLTAAATPFHSTFPIFCGRFPLFTDCGLEVTIPILWLEPGPTCGIGGGSFCVGKLEVRNTGCWIAKISRRLEPDPNLNKKNESSIYDVPQ